MTGLGRWLAGILNAHIERHNVPVAEPVPDTPLVRFYIGQLDAEDDEPEALHGGGITPFQLGGMTVDEAAQRLRDNLDRIAGKMTRPPTDRPCWACGDPAGFHAFHLPCCKVAPFKPASSPWERYP